MAFIETEYRYRGERAVKLRAHAICGGTVPAVWRTLDEAGHAIAPEYLPRFLLMLAVTLPASSIGWVEAALFDARIAKTPLAGPPIFILGHWRTGTTHIHNLLCLDAQFGFLTTFDAFSTNNTVVGRRFFRYLMRRGASKKRAMDDMAMDLDLPQEEEFALGNRSTLSYYKRHLFPSRSEHYAHRHLFFDGVPNAEIEAWKRCYDFVLRKTTWLVGSKPLVLKNPPNTARLRYLLDLYPDARVIYLYRDPCEVYLSTLRLWERTSEPFRLQPFDKALASEHVLATYPRMIRRFFDDLPRVRRGRFIAVRYEHLKEQPLAELERIYTRLDLPGFGETRPRFTHYLDQVRDYEPARYQPDAATVRMVEERWGNAHKLHDALATS